MDGTITVLLLALAAISALAIGLATGLIRTVGRAIPMKRTFDAASVGIVHVAMDGRWLRLNDKMLDITGYTREALLNMHFSDITADDDLPKNFEQNARLRNGEIDSYTLQKRYIRMDGSLVWVKISVNLVRLKDGTPDYYITIVEDIDELKRAEFELEEQQARFQAFWDNSPFNQSLKDLQGRLIAVNKTYQETYGISEQSIGGQTLKEAHGTDWGTEVDDFDREVLRTRTTRTADITVRGKHGQDLTIRVTKFPVYDRAGDVVGVGGVSYDITSQIRAIQEVRDSEERFRGTFEQAAVGIAHVALDGTWLRINQRYCDIVGYSEDELRQLTFRDITHPDDLALDLEVRDALVKSGHGSFTKEKRYLRKNGSFVWATVTASITAATPRQDAYLIVVVEDISDRKNAEQALAARLDQQETVVEIGQAALAEASLNAFLTKATKMVAETISVDACLISRGIPGTDGFQIIAASEEGQEFIGTEAYPDTQDNDDGYALFSSESVIFDNSDPARPDLKSVITEKIGSISGMTVVISGGETNFGILAAHSRQKREFTSDDVIFLKSVANVISATLVRDRISAELIDRERALNAILDNAADGIVVSNAQGEIIMANNAASEVFGYPLETLRTMRLLDLVPTTYPGKQAQSAHTSDVPTSAREMVGLRNDGTTVPIDIAMSEFEGPDGALHIALVRDITEQKSLQSQLVQASKLATVGEMAAGIAHELNQPLNIMRMAADNVLIRMDSGNADMDYAQENLNLISEQAARMGKIILHMRVFSRHDTSDFVPFDPVRPAQNACDLMRRQLELENLALEFDSESPDCFVDGSESQLEQVIINMITNARDAILSNAEHSGDKERNGTIKVIARPSDEDRTFMIRVLDNGGGISHDVLTRIFDPFFTTKDVGVGTGLGLSVSYGIVSSMDGTITARNTDEGCEMLIELPLGQTSLENPNATDSKAPMLQ